MADAKKCDRCGKYYDGSDKANGIIFVNSTFNDKDLCGECMESFNEWYKGVVINGTVSK